MMHALYLLFGVASLVAGSDDASMTSLMTLVEQQAATISSLQAVVSGMQARLTSLDATVQQHSAHLNNQVSFTAHMSHGLVTISDSPFLFDTVVNNAGDGYNPQTGVFTAPVPGSYIFYAHVMNHANSDEVNWGIYKSLQGLCSNHLTGSVNFYNTASCFATVHLQRGDVVFVKRFNNGVSIEGYIWTSFSGQLVSADPE